MKVDIGGLIQNITANPKPVVLIDTCTLLDIVRIPIREEGKAEQIIKGAGELLNYAKQGDLYLSVTNTVQYEYNNNFNDVFSEAKTKAIKLEQQTKHYVLASSLAGVPITGAGPFDPDALLTALSNLANDILKTAFVIDNDDACGGRAYTRSMLGVAPASRGKPEHKDCNIIEHYLEIARRLKQSSFAEKIAFVTSNSNDFGSMPSPRNPLDQDFQAVNLLYGNNFKWAVNKLTQP
jgi:hypothetical protein